MLEWLVRLIVICRSGFKTSITEEPYDERVTYGSVGGVARKGGSYLEKDVKASPFFAGAKAQKKVSPFTPLRLALGLHLIIEVETITFNY